MKRLLTLTVAAFALSLMSTAAFAGPSYGRGQSVARAAEVPQPAQTHYALTGQADQPLIWKSELQTVGPRHDRRIVFVREVAN